MSDHRVLASDGPAVRGSSLYQEGLVAGLLGAATIAIWFLVLDTVRGRPLYTPSLLGRAFFQRGAVLGALETQPITVEMVLVYTWVHGLAFCVIGGMAAWPIALAERRPNAGFGVPSSSSSSGSGSSWWPCWWPNPSCTR